MERWTCSVCNAVNVAVVVAAGAAAPVQNASASASGPHPRKGNTPTDVGRLLSCASCGTPSLKNLLIAHQCTLRPLKPKNEDHEESSAALISCNPATATDETSPTPPGHATARPEEPLKHFFAAERTVNDASAKKIPFPKATLATWPPSVATKGICNKKTKASSGAPGGHASSGRAMSPASLSLGRQRSEVWQCDTCMLTQSLSSQCRACFRLRIPPPSAEIRAPVFDFQRKKPRGFSFSGKGNRGQSGPPSSNYGGAATRARRVLSVTAAATSAIAARFGVLKRRVKGRTRSISVSDATTLMVDPSSPTPPTGSAAAATPPVPAQTGIKATRRGDMIAAAPGGDDASRDESIDADLVHIAEQAKTDHERVLTRAFGVSLIELEGIFVGVLTVTDRAIIFWGHRVDERGDDIISNERKSRRGHTGGNKGDEGQGAKKVPAQERLLRVQISSVTLLLSRRYRLRDSAFEIFCSRRLDHSSHLLSVSTGSSREETCTSARNRIMRLITAKSKGKLPVVARTPRHWFKKAGLTQRWVNREMSNCEYLLWLNSIAGRSFNDVNQFPIFPWVISDYESDTIDLNDPSCLRDLSKPMGVLGDEKRLQSFMERYESLKGDADMPPFHYGSHYSSAAVVLHFLVRLAPFSTLAREQQATSADGQTGVSAREGFDLPDRLFNDVGVVYRQCLTQLSTVFELIPHFYLYDGDFLTNSDNLNLGVRQDGAAVGDVHLPPWAKGSVSRFMQTMKDALESDYVSEHLHSWIDLIFGYKQRGTHAVDAANVFFYLTYEGAVDLDAIEDPARRRALELQIAYFGQTPSQLLTQPHPARRAAPTGESGNATEGPRRRVSHRGSICADAVGSSTVGPFAGAAAGVISAEPPTSPARDAVVKITQSAMGALVKAKQKLGGGSKRPSASMDKVSA